MSQPKRNPTEEAFTLVELLVAAAIGAALIAAAVVGFGVIANLPMRGGNVNVTLPAGIIPDFYGTNATFLTMGPNPNYFQGAQARRMKDRLLADVSASSAVFCLGRDTNGSPALRPFEFDASGNVDFRERATPARFRDFVTNPAFVAAFPTNQGGALATSNASIFLLGSLSNTTIYSNKLAVLATYEIDFVPTVDPPGGTVASVRRYTGTNTNVPTDYYHAYYPGETNGTDGFRPLAVFFERAAVDPDGTNAFALAANHPFTFLWWPDPLVSSLGAGAVPTAPTNARASYINMAGRTSLFFVLPAFPPL
jgi:hypothetical protein